MSDKTRVNWSATLKYGHCLNTVVFVFSEDLDQSGGEAARLGLACIGSRLANIPLRVADDTNVDT